MEIGLGLIVICLTIGALYWISKDNEKYNPKGKK